jgi:isoleucyl-tRNA synthetase
VARTGKLVADATAALEEQLTYRVIAAFESFVDDLSNWYIRRSRRRFYAYDDAAFRTLWFALVTGVRVISPVMPFLADICGGTRRRCLRRGAGECLPRGLAGGRSARRALLAEIAEVRRIVELGREARGTAGVKLRQPLRRVYVRERDRNRARARDRRGIAGGRGRVRPGASGPCPTAA